MNPLFNHNDYSTFYRHSSNYYTNSYQYFLNYYMIPIMTKRLKSAKQTSPMTSQIPIFKPHSERHVLLKHFMLSILTIHRWRDTSPHIFFFVNLLKNTTFQCKKRDGEEFFTFHPPHFCFPHSLLCFYYQLIKTSEQP